MATYTEASVVSLASLEHIRLRAGMYIGRLGDGSQVEDGIYTLFKEVVDNAIDEFIMGYGKTISILLMTLPSLYVILDEDSPRENDRLCFENQHGSKVHSRCLSFFCRIKWCWIKSGKCTF